MARFSIAHAEPKHERCANEPCKNGYVWRESYDGHRSDFHEERCPVCKKLFLDDEKKIQVEKNNLAAMILANKHADMIDRRVVQLDDGRIEEVIHWKRKEVPPNVAARPEQV